MPQKLFKGRNYSREETIHGSTVFINLCTSLIMQTRRMIWQSFFFNLKFFWENYLRNFYEDFLTPLRISTKVKFGRKTGKNFYVVFFLIKLRSADFGYNSFKCFCITARKFWEWMALTYWKSIFQIKLNLAGKMKKYLFWAHSVWKWSNADFRCDS